ncbi:MAG: putative metal-binding motif-containing protein [Nanoarchaeota archaeon]|nr:putative metal-binding motif-containing protein [Nanoarchaeota archaeon]
MKKKTILMHSILILILINISLFFIGCSGGGDPPCFGYRYDSPWPLERGACINECGSPSECDRTHPGGRGPGCGAGQVCNTDCECEGIDKDLDGYTINLNGTDLEDPKIHYNLFDCDDTNPSAYPGAVEICDNADNDCDDIVDEDDVCQRQIYICKTDDFTTQSEGLGENLSQGYCTDGEWCNSLAIGETGSCNYLTLEEDIGQNEFYAYACDYYNCYKVTDGDFMVCGEGWECEAICTPGDCNYDTKNWCNSLGIWQTDGWCHSECGKVDSTCGGNCAFGTCDIHAKKWCDDGYWTDENYCNCDICGTEDSTCSVCTCTDDTCDTINEKYCEGSIWKSDPYCLHCCQEDYDCYVSDYCETCVEGTCDTTNNQYCSGSQWISENYCSYCECCDFDCGTEQCEHGSCDTIQRLYCNEGVWINIGTSYCSPGYCGLEDLSCQCDNTNDNCCDDTTDGVCDPDCLQGVDPDCGACTSSPGDCCDDTPDGTCDTDCIPGVDSDCQANCSIGSDGCCSNLDDGNCDPDCTETSDPNCVAVCTTSSGDCCLPDADSICDADCIAGLDPDCVSPCEEEWICDGWDKDCDGVHDTHTCINWIDLNNCNTFFDQPPDTHDCHKEFTCGADDDVDGDGYPWRACYDAQNDIVLEELDCDDTNPSKNPEGEETCNGEDDNCDGNIDEDCPCQIGATQACGRNEGICRQGIQVCTSGRWGICGGSGHVVPQNEACNDGLDNNCDGFIDENCNCIEGATQECGSDIGICKKGWQACYNGTFGSFCNNETKGTAEICDNNLDDDCDDYEDGDDSNCQISTPVISQPSSCTNRKQDGDEEGVDCGGSCPTSCDQKTPACDYGKIKDKCVCGKAAYRTGYCCNGKYSIAPCTEEPKDSDNDGCIDDQELQIGTDLYNEDTDFDGLLDCDPGEELPLCNEDGICDSEKDYPETPENCPPDCEEEKISSVTPLLFVSIIISLLVLICVGGYLYARKKGKKLLDLIGMIKRKKKGERSKFQYGLPKKIQKKLSPVKQTSRAVKPKKNILHLRAFVRSSLKKGYTKLQIRKAASEQGWTKEEIDQTLKGKKSKYRLFK